MAVVCLVLGPENQPGDFLRGTREREAAEKLLLGFQSSSERIRKLKRPKKENKRKYTKTRATNPGKADRQIGHVYTDLENNTSSHNIQRERELNRQTAPSRSVRRKAEQWPPPGDNYLPFSPCPPSPFLSAKKTLQNMQGRITPSPPGPTPNTPPSDSPETTPETSKNSPYLRLEERQA